MLHHCHAAGCGKSVPPRLLMCAPHWRMVPVDVQRLVWATYARGQEVTKNPSRAYLAVQALSVALVAKREGLKQDAFEAMQRALSMAHQMREEGGVYDAIRGKLVAEIAPELLPAETPTGTRNPK